MGLHFSWGTQIEGERSMDVIHNPDNYISHLGTLRSHTARQSAAFGVRAQLQQEQQQQEQQQEQVLPLQRSLEVGQS